MGSFQLYKQSSKNSPIQNDVAAVSFKMAIVQVTIFLFFVAFSGANPYPKGYKNAGNDPTLNAFQWMVSLGYHESDTDQTWKPLCEGSILSDRIIITSKDCLDDHINDDMMIINNEEIKLQIRVGDEEFNDNDKDSKVYFADGFRKHDFNVALIATNQTIELNEETVEVIELPDEEQKFSSSAVDLAMWNVDGKLEEDINVKMPKKKCDQEKTEYQHCADMNTCKGSGASMVKDDGPLVGILGKDPNCENEVNPFGTFERTFAKVSHPEIWKFIKDSKKDLELCQSLKDCFCELRDYRC